MSKCHELMPLNGSRLMGNVLGSLYSLEKMYMGYINVVPGHDGIKSLIGQAPKN